jgi:hypothetical protein
MRLWIFDDPGRAGGGIRSLAVICIYNLEGGQFFRLMLPGDSRSLCPRPNIAYKRSKYVDVHDVEKCVYSHLWPV